MKILERIKWLGELVWKSSLTRYGIYGTLLLVGGMMSPDGNIGQWIDYKPNFTLWNWVMVIGAIGAVVETLVYMTYAWVINPIKDFKNRKK